MQIFSNIFYSFPIQLAVLHLRKFLFMLIPWILLVMMVTGNLLSRLGFHYLFLDPEYFGKVNFVSFFLIGIALGGFIFVWNITSYILNSFRFPFLATFERPFLRYTLNNCVYPLAFLIIYVYSIIRFQYYSELKSLPEIIIYQVALISGMAGMLIISLLGFLNFHIDRLAQLAGKKKDRHKTIIAHTSAFANKSHNAYSSAVRVDYVMIHPFRIRPVRRVHHYDISELLKVFRLHHKNALTIELVALLIIVFLGFQMEIPFFQIPAAASILLLLSIMLAPIGALSYWLRSWAVTAMIGLLIVANLLVKFGFVNHVNKAYGMDYSHPVAYNLKSIEDAVNPAVVEKDKQLGLQMLENWKKKVSASQRDKKPPLILVNASGGGLKASLWSLRLMQIADSATDDRFFDHCVFISGASGGMMGMAYYRELYRDKKLGDDIDLQNKRYIDNISKDILNAVSFTYVVNDMLFPWQRFSVNGFSYRKDRGYIFEKRLNQNTGFVMDKTLEEYAPYEASAAIPVMLFSPTIIDDGRRLLISSTPMSYLAEPGGLTASSNDMKVDGLDIHSFFKEQNGANLPFITALRMNSTFPYIMPNVFLPTIPAVQSMDAGLRDNYGFESAYRFIYEFRDWINENTSRVIIVQSRGDYEKNYEPLVNEHHSMIEKILEPINSLYAIWSDYQDYHQDEMTSMAGSWLKVDMNVVSFEYVPEKKDEIASMSLHLTAREKQNVLSTMENEVNRAKLDKLVSLLMQ